MKQISSVLILLLTLLSCVREEPVSPSKFRIYVGSDGQMTKTLLNTTDNSVIWEDTDELAVLINDGTAARLYRFTRVIGEDNAFESSDFLPERGVNYIYDILYPYSAALAEYGPEGYSPAEVAIGIRDGASLFQTGIDDASHVKGPLYARTVCEGGESPSVTMFHLSHILRAKVINDTPGEIDITNLRLSNNSSQALCGKFDLNFSNGGIRPSAGGDMLSTKLDINVGNGKIPAGQSGIIYIPTPAFTIPAGEDLTFTLTCNGTSVKIIKEFSSSLVCAAGGIRTANLRIDSDIYNEMTAARNCVTSFQLAYLRSLQIPSGAIRDELSDESKITPYFANFAALALLTDPTEENISAVRKYIQWYFGKLNSSVKSDNSREVAGSVYDYYLPGETTLETYDSVDSYAATFLGVLNRFAEISSSSRDFLLAYKDRISLIVSAMLEVIDMPSNGISAAGPYDCLSIAHPGYPVKFLMDNSEVNMGLRAAISLRDKSLCETTENLETILATNTESISAMWREANGNYDYALQNASDWSSFYPDATAQLYPAIFGAVTPEDAKSVRVYERFNSEYPQWHDGTSYDTFPWTMIAFAASVMGDKERVDSYIRYIYSLNANNEQMSYWYSAEAATLILAVSQLYGIN